MPDVVGQCQRLSQIFVETQHASDSTCDLRHLNGMRQTISEMIGNPRRKDLGLIFQTPERPGMDNAVPIPLKFIAVSVGKFGDSGVPEADATGKF